MEPVETCWRQSDWWGQLIVEGPAVKRDKYLLTRKLIFVLRHSKYFLMKKTNIYVRYYFRSVEVCNWQHEEMSWNGWEGVNEEWHFYKFSSYPADQQPIRSWRMRCAVITVAFAISVSGSSIWTHSNAVSYDGFSILEVSFEDMRICHMTDKITYCDGWWSLNLELQVAKNIWCTRLGHHMDFGHWCKNNLTRKDLLLNHVEPQSA